MKNPSITQSEDVFVHSLAPYAMKDNRSRGRRHPEPFHFYRSEFQRDRDRVVHTKAFRRLENKTQVFPFRFSDHFRTRLTHTLEVSQISTTIARALRINSDLCEVLALSHDIGHPPFGHEGEKVLDQIMKDHGSGFDHNLHALRIVEDFEVKYPEFRGLNLTYEVREGIVKHSNDWADSTQCYLDLSEYELGVKPTLEAQVIDVADEIAYNTADLDDGYRSGLLSLELILKEVPLFKKLSETIRGRYADLQERIWVSETLRCLIDYLVTDLIKCTDEKLKKLDVRKLDDIRNGEFRMVSMSPDTSLCNQQLKEFLTENLYSNSSLYSAQSITQRILQGLFHHYHGNPKELPPHHQSRLFDVGRARVVCDYIAGMTDGYASQRYNDILGSYY